MASKKQNNNKALENLKLELIEVLNKIPKSEVNLSTNFLLNVLSKLFILKKGKKNIDIHSVISYIDNITKNTNNKQHKVFWIKVYKIVKKFADKLESI